jgi:four helix bundle protein
LDETSYWLELLGDSGLVKAGRLESLKREAEELLSIFVTIVKRVKGKPSPKSKTCKALKA